MGLKRVDDHLKEELKDPYFRELYELDQQKLVIVKKILEYRIKHQWTQAQLAEKAGVTQQHISKIENGEFSNIFALEKVLSSLGLTIKIRLVPVSGNPRNTRNAQRSA